MAQASAGFAVRLRCGGSMLMRAALDFERGRIERMHARQGLRRDCVLLMANGERLMGDCGGLMCDRRQAIRDCGQLMRDCGRWMRDCTGLMATASRGVRKTLFRWRK
jgi:hypothetical protein